MTSPRYRRMVGQIAQLKRALLPRDIKRDLLELSPRVSVRALSFRILSHAELEHYLEERVIEIASAAETAWTNRQHVSRITLCLLAFSGRSLDRLPDTLKPPPKKKQTDWKELIKPDKRLSSSITTYKYGARSLNNGIREANIIGLLLPVGFDPDAIDEVLVTELNDFGIKRGEAAHSSAANQVRRGVNPRDEYEQVKRIVNALKDVDAALDVLLRQAQ